MQPIPPNEPISEQEVYTLSIQQLEKRREWLWTNLEETFRTISLVASMVPHTQEQWQRVTEVENHFRELWAHLEVTINAVTGYAISGSYSEQQWNTLADAIRAGLQLLQDVQSRDDITDGWLAGRDAFVSQIRKLLEENGTSTENTDHAV